MPLQWMSMLLARNYRKQAELVCVDSTSPQASKPFLSLYWSGCCYPSTISILCPDWPVFSFRLSITPVSGALSSLGLGCSHQITAVNHPPFAFENK